MDERVRRQTRWYGEPGDAESEPIARREFKALPTHGQAALVELLRRFRRGEERRGEAEFFQSVPGHPPLFELRAQVGNNPFRVLYFRDSPVHYVLVLAVYKNQRKLPKGDKEKAVRRLKRWREAAD